MSFILAPELQRDCAEVMQLPLCSLLLLNDAQYPWCVLVPRRSGIREVFELSAEDRGQLWQESDALSRCLQQLFNPDKLNIAALGNMVPQLHIHHIVRYKTDSAWPKPVWGAMPAQAYTPADLQQRMQQIKQDMETRI